MADPISGAVEPNAATFIECLRIASTLYSDVELAYWLNAPQPLAGMWTPAQLLARGEAGRLLSVLLAIDSGAYL